ncbi:MAG: pimeloyl-ACP methyl ester esterase BioH [Vibrio sp.]
MTKLNRQPQGIYWQSQGNGQNLVLIHGWGMNGAVWQQVMDVLSQSFCVHSVDLPGYGFSNEAAADDLDDICQQVLDSAPEKAVYLGWSLGGLVATQIALTQPSRVEKLITLASSPRFSANKELSADKAWRGIMPKVLTDFTQQLSDNFIKTVEGFMQLQAMGSPSVKDDVKWIKQQVFSRPMPNQAALAIGLDILAQVDLRSALADIQVPTLRLYGRLDGLVPKSIIPQVDAYMPNSESFVFQSSSHAPFMTEPELFCDKVSQFIG